MASMAPERALLGRRLLDDEVCSFDSSAAGYLTDFLVSVAGVVCALLAIRQRSFVQQGSQGSALAGIFAVSAMFYSVSFLFGGDAHLWIAVYRSQGDREEFSFGAENSLWIWMWFVAVVALPPAPISGLAMFLPASGSSTWIPAAGLISGAFSAAEAYMVVDPSLLQRLSGVPSLLVSVLVGLVATTWAACKALSGESHMWAIAAGSGAMLAGWLVALTAPAGCSDYCAADFDSLCPYPSAFNQNAVFHILLVLGLVAQYLGVSAMARRAYLPAMEPEGVGELTEAAAVCCCVTIQPTSKSLELIRMETTEELGEPSLLTRLCFCQCGPVQRQPSGLEHVEEVRNLAGVLMQVGDHSTAGSLSTLRWGTYDERTRTATMSVFGDYSLPGNQGVWTEPAGSCIWKILMFLARIGRFTYDFRFAEDFQSAEIGIRGNAAILCCCCFPCCPAWCQLPRFVTNETMVQSDDSIKGDHWVRNSGQCCVEPAFLYDLKAVQDDCGRPTRFAHLLEQAPQQTMLTF